MTTTDIAGIERGRSHDGCSGRSCSRHISAPFGLPYHLPREIGAFTPPQYVVGNSAQPGMD